MEIFYLRLQGKLLDASARSELRQSKAVPCLQELKSWLEKQRAEVLPKSPMAEAINYTLNQWEALNIYTCDGNLAIDNSIAERAIKPFAIGRKNWLFFGSDQGGKSLAILSSFTAYLPTVRNQSLDLSVRYADQVTHYSCRTTPHAFANQVI